MDITINSSPYAGNVSETLVNVNFSSGKGKMVLVNTGNTVLEIYINSDADEIYPGKRFEYNGYISTFKLRSRKGLGTYSLSADGIQQIIILTQAEYDDLPETKNTDGVVYLIKE